jgi:predicted acylesterase/phospholipase RssA
MSAMTDSDAATDWTGQKKVNLALQGGGSHGAFTWGVLDYLLEDERLGFEAITGTSAGALNAVVLAEGYLDGGRKGARKSLARFWRFRRSSGSFSTRSSSHFRCRPRWPIGGPTSSPITRAHTNSTRSTSILCATILRKWSISPKCAP